MPVNPDPLPGNQDFDTPETLTPSKKMKDGIRELPSILNPMNPELLIEGRDSEVAEILAPKKKEDIVMLPVNPDSEVATENLTPKKKEETLMLPVNPELLAKDQDSNVATKTLTSRNQDSDVATEILTTKKKEEIRMLPMNPDLLAINQDSNVTTESLTSKKKDSNVATKILTSRNQDSDVATEILTTTEGIMMLSNADNIENPINPDLLLGDHDDLEIEESMELVGNNKFNDNQINQIKSKSNSLTLFPQSLGRIRSVIRNRDQRDGGEQKINKPEIKQKTTVRKKKRETKKITQQRNQKTMDSYLSRSRSTRLTADEDQEGQGCEEFIAHSSKEAKEITFVNPEMNPGFENDVVENPKILGSTDASRIYC